MSMSTLTMNDSIKKDDDILIYLGKIVNSSGVPNVLTDFYYNVSHFLEQNDSIESRDYLGNVDRFIQKLDAKVHMDPADQKYEHIYHGVDVIVKRMVTELKKLNTLFDCAQLRHTGSSMSGVKVGLPHESDYILKVPECSGIDSSLLHRLFSRIVRYKTAVLTDGLEGHWIIHGVKAYERIWGFCIVMQSDADPKDSTSEKVGVTVDIVPVTQEEYTPGSLNENAEAYLSNNLDEFVQKEDFYSIYTFDRSSIDSESDCEYYVDILKEDICDTGIIENLLVKQLPEESKKVFRIAKFLIQNICVSSSNPVIPFDDIENLASETQQKLYGHKPSVSSYHIRIFFLHLLLHVHRSEAEARLKGSMLLFCLLDMLVQCKGDVLLCSVMLNHPLLRTEMSSIVMAPHIKRFEDIIDWLKTGDLTTAVEEVSLLNNKKLFETNDVDDGCPKVWYNPFETIN